MNNRLATRVFFIAIIYLTGTFMPAHGQYNERRILDGLSSSPTFYNIDEQMGRLFIIRDGKLRRAKNSNKAFSVQANGPFEIRVKLIADWQLSNGMPDIISIGRGADRLMEVGIGLLAMNTQHTDHFRTTNILHLQAVQYFRSIGEELLLAEWKGGAFRADFNMNWVLNLINGTSAILTEGRHDLLLEFLLIPK